MILEESNSNIKKEKRLRGFAAMVDRILKPVANTEEFKQFSKTINIKLLLNPIDDKNAALISIGDGLLKVEGIRNEDSSNLKKKKIKWNGKMTTNLQNFLEISSGDISQIKLIKMIIMRKVKVRGLMYFLLLQRIISFSPESKEPKLLFLQSTKKPLFATRLIMLTGFIHVFIMSYAFIFGEYSQTILAYWFAYFCIYFGYLFSKTVKSNVMNESFLLRTITSILFLNFIAYLTFIFTSIIEGLDALNITLNLFYVIVLCLNTISFSILFSTKSKLTKMDRDEKINYFSMILTIGLGWNLLFSIFTYFFESQFDLISLCFIAGILVWMFGDKLMKNPDNVRINYMVLIISYLILISSIALYILVTHDPKFILNIGLSGLVIVTRYYDIKMRF